MNISDVQKELEELQKRVAQLDDNKQQNEEAQEQQNEDKNEQIKQQEINDFIDQKMASDNNEDNTEGNIELAEVKQHFAKLIEDLKDNINDVPTMTCLTIFIAGILVGKGIK